MEVYNNLAGNCYYLQFYVTECHIVKLTILKVTKHKRYVFMHRYMT